MISTNYAVKGEGNSHDRRRHEIEISQHYGKELTPEDEFKRQLFDEWDELEYQKFYNYMVYCLQVYLKNGLVKQNSKNLKLRRFMAETSMEFYEWINDVAKIPFNKRNDKKVYYNQFIEEYPDMKRWLTNRRFSIWLDKYAKHNEWDFKYGSSNGMQWFEIINPHAEDVESDDIEF